MPKYDAYSYPMYGAHTATPIYGAYIYGMYIAHTYIYIYIYGAHTYIWRPHLYMVHIHLPYEWCLSIHAAKYGANIYPMYGAYTYPIYGVYTYPEYSAYTRFVLIKPVN